MPTIKDIARLAGVSIATVSRVLNHHPYVQEDKRRRVEAIIEELNYRQNMNAVHLVKGKTRTIGVLLPYIDHPAFQLMAGGILEAAFQLQHSVLFCPTNYSEQEEQNYLLMLKQKQIDGLVVCSHASSWEEILPYRKYGPIAACEYVPDLPCVYIDYYEALLSGMRYLRSQGHQRIGYCTGRPEGASSLKRLAAYRDFCRELELPMHEEWIYDGCFVFEDGKRVIRELVQLKDRPTALLVNGDEVAAGMLLQAKLEGLSIPGDLSIVGADNQPFSEALALTTIDLNIKEVGRRSLGLLLSGENRQVCVPHELVVRQTVRSL
ncbi:hypothetical protein AWM70_15815 [Paenibacillus yonginensis]|uniref:HTH lacI-type domain-containing protein n=1 Tax=Paenibacillus yonginensis TaxID=1462996 RepID=A0A1B1N362_9BACL|nr:LacI family DNA-binding transcriptional regulator [Paenibacillus yonginensis]ANS75873.1 hypothetical protein AWM70_15815 [Paenibacillus yonginensis]